MPKISNEDISKDYFEHYLLTVIMPDGTIIALERGIIEEASFHGQAFKQLIIEMRKVLQRPIMLKPLDGCYNNLNNFAEKNIIPISTYYIHQVPYSLSSDIQIIKFLKKLKKAQIKAMDRLLVIFESIGEVYFNEQGIGDAQEQKGLDNLREYISVKIEELQEMEK